MENQICLIKSKVLQRLNAIRLLLNIRRFYSADPSRRNLIECKKSFSVTSTCFHMLPSCLAFQEKYLALFIRTNWSRLASKEERQWVAIRKKNLHFPCTRHNVEKGKGYLKGRKRNSDARGKITCQWRARIVEDLFRFVNKKYPKTTHLQLQQFDSEQRKWLPFSFLFLTDSTWGRRQCH